MVKGTMSIKWSRSLDAYESGTVLETIRERDGLKREWS